MPKTSYSNLATHDADVHFPVRQMLRLLILDPERTVRDLARTIGESLGFDVATADDVSAAFRLLENQAIDIILLDTAIPDVDTIQVLRVIHERYPDSLVIGLTASPRVSDAVRWMREGVSDVLVGPVTERDLRNSLAVATGEVKLSAENRLLRETVHRHHSFGTIVGQSPEMEKLYRIIAKVAKSNHPVLINGESGTGKELVARQIHSSGPNRDKPFIPVDCGSLVPTLIESELFGYVKGAFTGAVRAKEGLLQIAEGGTVFLDEIGELPIDLQSKLLRAIQEREIRPVGSTKTVSTNVRILAATNRDLEEAVNQGTFRKDLFFRLNVVHLRIPPLRERRQDIEVLIEHFLARMNRTSGMERTLSADARRRMMQYDWPGNVRELENCVERAGALTTGSEIKVSDLPSQLQVGSPYLKSAIAKHQQIGVVSIAEMEKYAIYDALEKTGGDKIKAARILGIGKTTLYRKLKEYGQKNC
jgi:two-component system response regulator HydG